MKLYYNSTDYIEIGGIPWSLYIKTIIGLQHDEDNRGWGYARSFTETTLTLPEAVATSVLDSFTQLTPLYLSPGLQRKTKWAVKKGQVTYPAKALFFYYDGIEVCRQRYYDDWDTDSSKTYFVSLFGANSDGELWSDEKGFVNRMFDFEVEVMNGKWSVESIGQTSLTFPFVLMHTTSEGNIFTQWEHYPDNSCSLLPYVCSAASMVQGLLNYQAIQTSTMKLSDGTEFTPATVYDPSRWVQLEGKYSYDKQIETTVDGVSVRSGYNEYTKVYNNHYSAGVELSYEDETVTQLYELSPNFVQIGTIFYDYPKIPAHYDNVFMKRDSWMSQIPEYRTYGDKYYCVLQLKDYQSLKNVCLEQADSSELLRLSTESGYIQSVCVMLMSLTRNEAIIWDAGECVRIPTGYTGGSVNNLTGNLALEIFFANDETPDDIEDVTMSGGGQTIPGNTGGGGYTDEGEIGGGGTWSDEGDDTTVSRDPDGLDTDKIAGLPDEGVLGSLKTNTYLLHMTESQLGELMKLVWDETFLDWLKNKFARGGITTGILSVKYGNVNMNPGEAVQVNGIAGHRLTEPLFASRLTQYRRYDFGEIELPNYFGSFLDFEPYTQVTLYLPKVSSGIAIPCSLAVGKKIQVVLTIDFMTGQGVYIVQNNDGTQIATVDCMCLDEMPYAERENTANVANAANNIALNTQNYTSSVSLLEKSRASLNAGHTEMAGLHRRGTDVARAAAIDKNLTNLSTNVLPQTAGAVAGAAVGTGLAVVKEAWNLATSFSNTWNAGSSASLGGNNVAILKISRVYAEYPNDYVHMFGLPSSQIVKLGECKGYLETCKIYPNFSIATSRLLELSEILNDGVYM